jgi:hypothetical protein
MNTSKVILFPTARRVSDHTVRIEGENGLQILLTAAGARELRDQLTLAIAGVSPPDASLPTPPEEPKP